MSGAKRGHASLMGAAIGGYAVEALIGRGAMGTVYLARDTGLNRRVALKVLLGSLARSPALVKRFHMEAQAAAPLRHPNVVRVYSAGVEDGTPYIAMEYVEGEPLDRFLRRKGTVRWQHALYIAAQVAEALDCAHGNGVIHRDVKPANVMLDKVGRVRLTDFGIANVHVEGEEFPEDVGLLGTPQYMSPEQCAGRELGPASDLFSLGVTLYQMISGTMPFRGESTAALMKSICNDDPLRLNRVMRGVPDDVARLTAHLLEKEPGRRPRDARAVCRRIARIQNEKGGTSAMPAALTAFIKEQAEPRALKALTPVPGAQKPEKKRHSGNQQAWVRRVSMAAALVVLMCCAAAGPYYWESAQLGRRPQQAPAIGTVRFSKTAPNTLIGRLDSPSYRFSDVAWVGDAPAAVVRVEGKQGTLLEGATGLLAANPIAHEFLSLIAPSGPGTDSAYWQCCKPAAAHCAIPPAPEGTPLHQAVLVQACEDGLRDGPCSLVMVAQKWNEAEPRRAVLCRMTADAGTMWNLHAPNGPPLCQAVAAPDGRTVCLLVYQGRHGAYLAERDVSIKPADRLDAQITGLRSDIIPHSMQYAPDGLKLAYMRASGKNERELRVVATGGAELDGHPVAVGALGPHAPWSPDGRYMAIECAAGSGEEPEVSLIDTATARLAARLGPGRLAPEPWHPSGVYLVLTVPGSGTQSIGEGPRQLWAVEARPPYRRVRLTSFPGGVSDVYGVSRDGRWVAAALATDAAPAMAFLELRPIAFDASA